MHLIAGLGNPGSKYAGNRHNVGFMVADFLASGWKLGAFREKFDGVFAKGSSGVEPVVVLKPMTFMNLSGEAVQKAMRFFKVPLERLLVVHDELDLPFGSARIKVGGGSAGHNGLKSITQHVGGGFVRLRVGIGRPASPDPTGHVLGDFGTDERRELAGLVERAASMVAAIVDEGAEAAMNRHHRR